MATSSSLPHPPSSHLDNCKTIKHLKQIHSLMIRTGLAHSLADQRRLLSFCCAHHMDYARLLFAGIPNPHPTLWNSMIKGYSNRHSPQSALLIYTQMLANGFLPNAHTYPFLLKSFTRETATGFSDEIHAHILKFGLTANPFVNNALICIYSRSGEVETARELFDRSPKRDAVIWNAMLSGYNKNKQFDETCRLFRGMEKENVRPTTVTLITVLSACSKLKDLEQGTQIHRSIQASGIVPEPKLENALIDMYTSCGNMNAAEALFESMSGRDRISWTAMVVGYANSGQIDYARVVFDQMPERDAISWTAMIDGYVRSNRFKDALEIFRGMQGARIRPDEFTIVSMLAACAQLGALGVGEWVRAYMDRNKIKADIFVENALIDMYCKCGSMESAGAVFRGMKRRDKFTWTAMILGFAVNGRGEQALELFSKMVGASVRPDEVTFVGVLSACTHAGLVDEGRKFFTDMITSHGIMPNVVHYGCLVDLLGRAGQLAEALETIQNMPMRPNCAVWGALLGACKAHRNVEMAELAAKRLLELEPKDSAAYVLLSNIYAKCNKWEEVRKVRDMMMERGIKKMPGCSLIEMNGVVHEFVAGDISHPRCDDIYNKLAEIGSELKLAGYASDTSEVFLDVSEEEKENSIYRHSEKLAIAFGLLNSEPGSTIRVVKNLRMCLDCHNAIKIISRVYGREVIVRDRTRFHHFRYGLCSCKDYW